MSEVVASKPATSNQLVAFINLILRTLVNIGAAAAQTAATAAQPWLGWPIIKEIFSDVLTQLKLVFDIVVIERVDQIVIQKQGDWKQAGYDEAAAKYKADLHNASVTNAQQAADLAALRIQVHKLIEQNTAAT